jgi:hypothetical protein
MSGQKNDFGKLPLGIVIQRQFPNALKMVAEASLYGHLKYLETDADFMNCRRVPNPKERYLNAMFRHLLDSGIDLDEKDAESKLPHIVHAVWNGLQLLEAIAHEGKETK